MLLASTVPVASNVDLQRIVGYVAWLAYAMGWPLFMATLIYNRNTFWIFHFHQHRHIHQPRQMGQRLIPRQLYTDATPTRAAVFLGPPKLAYTYPIQPPRQIAWAETSAAIEGIIWCAQQALEQPTTLTVFTDSTIVYHTLVKGKGWTLRASPLLQNRYVQMYRMLNKAGHCLVTRWIPSDRNLADPLTRGVPSNYA
jgi:hypothetical protein